MITRDDIRQATIYINGVDVYSELGILVEKYSIGATPITNSVYQGGHSTSYNLLYSDFGRRSIKVSLFITAPTRAVLSGKKTALDAMLWGKLELLMPDGFFYTSVLKSAGELNPVGAEENQIIALCSYEFEGIQHGELVKSVGNTIICESTMPYTNCKLTCTASQNRASLAIGSVTITSVSANDVLTVDGINGRILQNGAPCAGNMSFTKFPQLVPGSNTITCAETLTIEYYPTFI